MIYKRTYFIAIVLLMSGLCCALAQKNNTVRKKVSVQEVDIRKFGAVGDSVTINTKAVQKAIDYCAQKGGGAVLIAGGVYSSGAIFLKSNVELKITKGAKLRGVAGLEHYPVLKNTRVAGIEMDWPSAFINAINADNVHISGEGTIDGSGYYWWQDYWIKRDSLKRTVLPDLIDWYVPRPRLILFDKVSNAGISGLKLMNSGFWTVHICYSKSIELLDLNIYNPVLDEGKKAASTDGIDLDSSRDILVRNCTISVDDDCIAVKSGRGSDGLRINIPTENVVIEDCLFQKGHGGVSMGTETAGGVRNILIRNCRADGNNAAIKFKPRPGRGGVIENITHEGWDIRNGDVAIDYALRKVTGEDYIDEWQKIKVPFENATPKYRNITIRNVTAANMKKAITFLGWPLAHAENIVLQDVSIQAQEAGSFEYVDNLLLKNVNVESKGKALEFFNVVNLKR
ncbi:glycoside hydrolase family 28 protein [Dyadobacter psychrophilus]|uniref:Glycosyl hydrolases family 28 n=1 Tax=Dyadobacter psychrophilus TaxID=651661 RepID=A0A1T5DAN8_9BACT|nr:glycoside hydrolase family 28 protein [Dyadobacter psychrophilus]SKB68735.1 Glycosyl hydrolases family 28 [Dyadobacter psychrophilus]